jgi:hypothetical protein
MKTLAAPADRSSRNAAPDSVFGLEALLACRRSEAFPEDLADVPDLYNATLPPAPSRRASDRGFALRLGWLQR